MHLSEQERLFHLEGIQESRRRKRSAGENWPYYLHTEASHLFQIGDNIRSAVCWIEFYSAAFSSPKLKHMLPQALKLMARAEKHERHGSSYEDARRRWETITDAAEHFTGIILDAPRAALKISKR